jgi:hypothetical protein
LSRKIFIGVLNYYLDFCFLMAYSPVAERFNRGVKLWSMKRKERMLTAVQFSKEIGASYPTVISWLEQGIVPGATKKSDHRGEYWEIPESALNMERPKRGRKPSQKKGEKSMT